MDTATGFTISLISQGFLIVMIPLLAMIADRIGRKSMMLAGSVAIALLAVPCFDLPTVESVGQRLIALLALNLCLAALLSCIYSVVPSLFGTVVRFTGVAVAYNVSVALFAGTVPMIKS